MSNNTSEDQQRLQQRLNAFLDQARENESKMRRFQEQELRLIGTRSLTELIKAVLYNYKNEFELDAVSLVLYDPQYEIHRILDEEGVRIEEHPSLQFLSNKSALESLFGISPQPILGAYDKQQLQFLFPTPTVELNSIALLPLVRYDELIGSFNLGSTSANRFSVESATDFLQRLSTIVAICIENASNHERLKRVGLTDSLTGINNRRFFDQRLGEEIARSQRTGESISCLFLDVDHFKKINDIHGHQIGDRVLRQVASLIREQLRNCDVLGRYGGEEFAVILANTASDTAMEIAERIRQSIDQYNFLLSEHTQPLDIHVTISIGVSTINMRYCESDVNEIGQRLLEHADNALYKAKNSGRNQVQNALTDNNTNTNIPPIHNTEDAVI